MRQGLQAQVVQGHQGHEDHQAQLAHQVLQVQVVQERQGHDSHQAQVAHPVRQGLQAQVEQAQLARPALQAQAVHQGCEEPLAQGLVRELLVLRALGRAQVQIMVQQAGALVRQALLARSSQAHLALLGGSHLPEQAPNCEACLDTLDHIASFSMPEREPPSKTSI